MSIPREKSVCDARIERERRRRRSHSRKGGLDQWSVRDQSELPGNEARGLKRPPPAPELRDEPVAVATVDRAREFDDVVLVGAGDALEEERRRVERHAEELRFLVVRDGRLDCLRAAGDLDSVALLEQVVEG